ncbi:MAG: UDP-N-acetylmuramate--L-alanine ligase [Candidatus Gracilibacteria bacterium]|nr:UDP-N-acetylmuramate--L-alanine ligase [Candidatus Gracilibacteria bacterium]
MQKKVYLIGIGGIGISAIARYYNELGYLVFGSDKFDSELIHKLKSEGIDIIIGERANFIDDSFEKIIYTEAIPETQSELQQARKTKAQILTYPESLANIANSKKLITISGTHGKSTTTSLASIILKNSDKNITSVVGTLLKEFDGKNFFHRNENKNSPDYFIIEACEYKRSFLKYKPDIAIITNIEIDHLDYYKDLNDYILAYRQLIDNVKKGGYVILDGQEKNSQTLVGLRQDIKYINVYKDYFLLNGQKYYFPEIKLNIPGEHIVYDAKLTYILGILLKIDIKTILDTYNKYNGVWRRMEKIGLTENGNLLLSDYGHHPTEIKLTLEAIKINNKNKTLLTIFQPHQYNRTLELLPDFVDSFKDTDYLIIPNIYESRDNEDDKKMMPPQKFVDAINHKNKINGNGLDNTLKLIEDFDKKNKDAIIILMGAGDVDNLRYKIKTTL